MFKRIAIVLAGAVAVVPSGCDPWQMCEHLDVIGPYLPPEMLSVLEELCSMPHIM